MTLAAKESARERTEMSRVQASLLTPATQRSVPAKANRPLRRANSADLPPLCEQPAPYQFPSILTTKKIRRPPPSGNSSLADTFPSPLARLPAHFALPPGFRGFQGDSASRVGFRCRSPSRSSLSHFRDTHSKYSPNPDSANRKYRISGMLEPFNCAFSCHLHTYSAYRWPEIAICSAPVCLVRTSLGNLLRRSIQDSPGDVE